MIGEVNSRDSWRRWSVVLLTLTVVVPSGLLLGRTITSDAAQVPAAAHSASPSPTVAAAPSPVVTSAAPAPAKTPDPLSLPGAVPTHGPGDFAYVSTRSPVLGRSGPLRRFHVAVEKGSNEDVAGFAEQVVAILGDARSWVGGGQVRLQMVPGGEQADFTVYLATRDTAGRLCERGGTNIRISGVPYTSCRTVGKAIINLDRWRLSAKPYLTAKIPLAVYRQYVINHEVGHELGHHHQGCPRAGGPAPVMVQQTLTTRGCTPYPWPRRGNGFLTGPGL